jgi:GPH family glycoside/pentoside/hexuronide:cation symporter
MYFYTDVYGIEAAAAGTLMIVVRFFDAITDPLMGAVADRTRTRWGRYRPWLLWIAIPYGILAVTAFITPDVAAGTKLVYAYISYALLMTAYTAVNIPYSALAGVMTSDKDERSGLQSWRFGMAMVGGFLVTVSIWPLSRLLGGGGNPEELQLGFPFAVALLAIVGVIALFGCFAWTRERTYPDEATQQAGATRTNMLEDLGAMFRNSQWLIVSLAMFVIQIRGGLQGSVKPHFIKYYIDHDLTGVFAITENFMALYMGLTMLAGVAGVIVANRLFLKLQWCKVSVMKTALLGSLVPGPEPAPALRPGAAVAPSSATACGRLAPAGARRTGYRRLQLDALQCRADHRGDQHHPGQHLPAADDFYRRRSATRRMAATPRLVGAGAGGGRSAGADHPR